MATSGPPRRSRPSGGLGDPEAAGGGPALTVRVVPDVPALRRTFDYLVPGEQADLVAVGTEVRVVLHGRRVRAWVAEVGVEPPPGVAVRPVTAVRSVGPPPGVVALAAWAAWRWAGTVPTFLRTASSPTVVRPLPAGPRRAPAAGGPEAVGGSAGVGRRNVGAPRSGVDPAAVLAGGTAVVRVGPASDPTDLLVAAAGRLRAGARGGVLVVVPEVRQVRAVAAALRRHGVPVAELPGGWAVARRGGCVAVGTRAAAWAPLPELRAAVVLDAHDDALVEQRAPTWSAWQVVAERARRDGAPCALVSPCPTLDLLAAGRLLAPDRTAERLGWPPVEVVDRRSADPRHGLLSPRVADLARWAVAPGDGTSPGGPERRVVCVVNRTGGVRLVACAACGELDRCPQCQGALEQVEVPAPALRCRRCATERPVVCARCGSTSTRALRLGSARLRRDLQALAGAPVAEVTGAVADGDGDPAGGAAVVVGTDAALRRLAHADAVVVLDLDTVLLAPRLRAAEEAMALVVRAARLVRRSALPSAAGRGAGRLVLQTRQPSHPVVRAAVAGDPGLVAAAELPVRQALRLPPVTAVAELSGPGAADYAGALQAKAGAAVEVDGPLDGTWTVRAPDASALCDALASVDRPSERVRVEVDPLHL